MVIAVPVESGRIAEHFGQCEGFDVFHIDPDSHAIREKKFVSLSLRQEEGIEEYLLRHNIRAVLVKRITTRDYQKLKGAYIFVAPGVETVHPEEAVQGHLDGSLQCCVYP